jgi:hypothetical protein
MTAHGPANATSWAVYDRPYKSRLVPIHLLRATSLESDGWKAMKMAQSER